MITVVNRNPDSFHADDAAARAVIAPAVIDGADPPAAARWWSRWPWWVQVLAVYAGARLVSAGIFLAVAGTQEANLWTPAAPSYADYTGGMWDADWYRQIAEGGYPESLPRGADGGVQQNAWAFFPLFPALARAVMQVTGGSWNLVAPTLALLLGGVAMLVVHRLVAAVAPGRGLPLVTVLLLSTFASAPVLQTAYTESAALALLAAVLWCLVRRRYLLGVPLVLVLGCTRAVALPVVVAVSAHGFSRWREARDCGRPFTDGLRIAVLGAAAGVAGLLWPALVGVLTGEPDAYAQTQAAWRGRGAVVPVLPWFDVARWLFGPLGTVIVVALFALAVAAVVRLRRLGPELQGWTGGYLAYLLVVVEPGSSLVRFLLLAVGLAAGLGAWALRSRWWPALLSALVVFGIAGQVAWIGLLWRLVPPSGWPP